MDGRARFALAQAAKDHNRAAKTKTGLVENLYSDLTRSHRKLNKCRIRASEVHVKCNKVKTDTSQDWYSSIRARTADSRGVRLKPVVSHAVSRPHTQGQKRATGSTDNGYALPSYIVEMNRELLEDDFELPDADRVVVPGPLCVDLNDIGLGLGEATAGANTSMMSAGAHTSMMSSTMTGFGSEQPSCFLAGGPLAELSVATGASAPGVSAGGATAARGGATHRERLAPIVVKGGAKPSESAVPTKPIVETMPQHLASDLYWAHRPVYVSAQQVRWEKRDGSQTLIAMRREFMQKMCLDGLPRSAVGTAYPSGGGLTGFPDKRSGPDKLRKVGPAEAKILASEPMRSICPVAVALPKRKLVTR